MERGLVSVITHGTWNLLKMVRPSSGAAPGKLRTMSWLTGQPMHDQSDTDAFLSVATRPTVEAYASQLSVPGIPTTTRSSQLFATSV